MKWAGGVPPTARISGSAPHDTLIVMAVVFAVAVLPVGMSEVVVSHSSIAAASPSSYDFASNRQGSDRDVPRPSRSRPDHPKSGRCAKTEK
jgi:hypothetical protein